MSSIGVACQVTVNMDKLQEQKDNFAAYQRESAAAIAEQEKATERLRAELKSLGDRLEATTRQLVGSRRQEQVLGSKLRDAEARAVVRLPSCFCLEQTLSPSADPVLQAWACDPPPPPLPLALLPEDP